MSWSLSAKEFVSVQILNIHNCQEILLSHQDCSAQMHHSFQIALAGFTQEVAQASTFPRVEYQSVSWIRMGVPLQRCVWEVNRKAPFSMPDCQRSCKSIKFIQSKYMHISIIYFPRIIFWHLLHLQHFQQFKQGYGNYWEH